MEEKMYAIRVVETLAKTIIVKKAKSLEDAISKVEEAVDNDRVMLSYDDFAEREFEASYVFENGIVPEDRDVSYYEMID